MDNEKLSKHIPSADDGDVIADTAEYNSNEIQRFKVEHRLLISIWQMCFSAPVEEILTSGSAKVLDVECGYGIWLTEVAHEYPKATFIGIDSSKKISYYGTFDYVHFRNGSIAVSTDPKIIPEMVRVLKVGGFIELCEVDAHNVNEGPFMKRIANSDGMIGEKVDEILLKNGKITNIIHLQRYGQLGTWGGEKGTMAVKNFRNNWLALKYQLAEFMKISPEEFDTLVEDCVRETELFRTYFKTHRIYGQKIK
ncbi:11739_t:CDS:2 [Diversispora eburnea]|uniref:11739_t:CDS:1 n=1 Tax=Diversispora eburnea TaxID=1213867 RepID=A0A9N8VRA1_9GLOM|nr:11739_t:CDS:2 [Diversispora eburnea]